MSKFGWAYVNDVITGSGGTPGGSDKAIQFASGSSFSGSTNFTFDYTTNTVRLTGTLYADTLIVSSSTIFKSGSTKFGDDPTDTHQFTGSVLISGSLTATSASFLDYVQLGTSLSDEVYFNASSKTNIQPATTNDVDLGASSRYWRTGYITTLSSSAISSSVNIRTGEVTATSAIINGPISSSGNINGSGLQISGGGQFGGTVTVTGSVSASANLQTAGDITAGTNLTVNNFATIKNGLIVTGSSTISGALTVLGTMSSSFINGNGTGITDINGANVNGVGDDWTIQFKNGVGGTLTGSSGLTFSGSTLTLTGSFLMTGSSTFINIGPTILSGNLDVSGTVSASVATFSVLTASNSLVTNTTTIANYAQFLPANITIPTNQTASYIYTSGSTNDLYFTQYSGALENTTRLRWLEGSLGTGLQYGGLLSTVNGTTTFSITAGAGIIVTQNASTSSDPYPTIKQVNWSNFVSQSLLYSGSAQITYVSIDTNGQVGQSITPPTLAQFKDRIVLGRVLHQSASVSNGTINSPAMAYAQTANIFDFIRSFGPLKISGHVLAASGSTLGITKTAGASYSEGRNYSSDPNQPNIILASADPAITVTKIFRQYVSGSTPIILTNGNLGYTAVDPSQYNNNGITSSVGNSEWTNQRVYWFPKSVNQALFVYYGTQKYGTELEAVAGLLTENFVEGENTLNAAIYVGSITLKGNETSLTSTDVTISQGGLFRAAGGGGGGGGGGSTPPAGLTTEVQFNDGGAFGADTDFTFSKATNTLSVPNLNAGSITSNTDVEVLSNLRAGSFVLPSSNNLEFYNDDSIGSNPLFTINDSGDLYSPTVTVGNLANGGSLVVYGTITGDGSGLTNITSPKYAIFYANGVTTGSNYEIVTINANKYLQLKRRKNFPTARAIGLTNSEYGWTWLNRSSLSSVSSSTENVSSSNAANLIHSSLSSTTWFGGTATAPVRYRDYNLQAGQTLQVTTKISAYTVSNYDQTQAIVWLSGSVDKYVRFGVGYDNGLYATAQANIGGTTNHTITSGEAAAGIWWTMNVTPSRYSLYYNLSTGSTTPPTSGWIFSQGNTFVNASATTVGNAISVGQMLMTGKSNAAITSTGSFHYFDIQVKPHEEDGYFVPNSYYRWGSAQYDTSGTEQLIGEFDLGSTSATIDQTKLRLALADLVNNLSGDSATVTWSAVQSSSSGASSSTYYDAASVVVSGTGRYFRLWMKVTSSANTGGSIGPFPITIPIS